MSRLEIDQVGASALGPVTFTIAAGECVCLSGPSGSGKSRLLRAIADLDDHHGDVRLDGTSRQDFPAFKWRQAVGLLPSQAHWWKERVGDHLAAVDCNLLEALDLDESLLWDRVTRLSSGERQRFALLRLLANRPQALLLDEPTANLDTANIERVERVLAAYRTQNAVPVVWVTHDSQQSQRVANRRLWMTRGRLSERAGARR